VASAAGAKLITTMLRRLMPADALKIARQPQSLPTCWRRSRWPARSVCRWPRTLHGLRDYAGEPHRCQLVARIDEVEYFDDSKGTNVGATVAALDGARLGRIVLIAGGDGKGQDFAPLAAPVQRHARAVVLIGRDADGIAHALARTGVTLARAGTLDEAVTLARTLAQAGDAVLLSPACASFDMFDNYAHRAQVFVDAVRRIAEEAGVASPTLRLPGLAARRDGMAVPVRRGLGLEDEAHRHPGDVGRRDARAAGSGDGLFGDDRAAGFTAFREVRLRPTSSCGTPSRSCWAPWLRWPHSPCRCGNRQRIAPLLFLAGLIMLGAGADPGRGQGGLRCAALAVPLRPEPAALGTDETVRRVVCRRLRGAQAGGDAPVQEGLPADGRWRSSWSACCCCSSPISAHSW
jgi:hypothetical protein